MIEEKWHQMTLPQQLGNLLAEISRAANWEKTNKLENRNNCLERALELIDLTLTDSRNFGRSRELGILREAIADCYVDSNYFSVSLKAIQNYLLPFAILARS
ncbi:MAG: hypothetical protein WCT26_00230 [Candidatus Buchananbacteria bacterium]|jgi:hypothetical protein